ncbi:MAG: hypothetical protein ACI4CS_09645 [Candidatus Weimeria sp.]
MREEKRLSEELINDIDRFIVENFKLAEERCMTVDSSTAFGTASLDDFLVGSGESFSDMLFRMIDERGLKDSDVYKKACIDRRLFSKIRSKKNYHVGKNTIFSLCLVMELNEDESEGLLQAAGYTFAPGSIRDLIVEYCIINHIYDIDTVDEILVHYGEKALIKGE